MKVGVAEPDADDLRLMSNGARMATALPYIEYEVNKMIEVTKTEALTALRKGELTPDMALAYWQMLASHERLLKRLQTHVKMGISAAERVDPQPIGD